MALAVVIFLLVIGSLAFHFLSPWYFTPIASNWSTIDTTVDITFWVTGIVFVLVNMFMAYCVLRFRHKKGNRALYEPENKKLETWLTVITAIGVAAMLAPGLFVWAQFVTVPDDAIEVEAVGQQWHWSFRFPGEDGVLGEVDPRLISPENPFGMDADDPSGMDDVLIADPNVHLPLDQPVKVLLRSKDVLHDFAVPQFRVKMDLVPGTVSYLWFTPTRTGAFEILCEELCGLAHHTMRAKVFVDEPEDFQAWLGSQPTYAQTAAVPAGDATIGQALYAPCAACHGFQGEGNEQLNAPKLAGQEAWYMAGQLRDYKRGIRGSNPEDVNGRQMAAMANTLIDDAAINNVIAYIQTLPDNPAPATVAGDIDAGREIYETCGACHGLEGQGIWAMNAPRQAGMSDWYLVEQLKNFRAGIRGAHERDAYGLQMRLMAEILAEDQAIDDVVAYINTLPGPERLSQEKTDRNINKL
jgi:cytochrome c oxidase subunit 2